MKVGLLLCALFPVAYADLPVHCLRHQVAGDWEFTLGPTSSRRSSCGHQKPDSQEAEPPMNFLASLGATSTKKFTLGDPDTATSESGGVGTWTMIYDEGFEVAVDGQTFFAFSKFEFINDPVKGHTNISHCDQTEVGWYHNEDRSQWGCYVAKKATPSWETAAAAPEAPAAPAQPAPAAPKASLSWLGSTQWSDLTAAVPAAEPAAAAVPVEEHTDFSAERPDSYKPWIPGSAGYDAPITNEWQQAVADKLNLLQLSWKAEPYRHFVDQTPREMNRRAGLRRAKPKSKPSLEQPSSFLGLRSKVQRYATQESTFDWRSKDGQNWLGDVITQGDCGSCYTISTVNMLSARNRIRANDVNAEPFSIMFPLYCSEYNQGCDGGYGFLQSKWAEDVGMVPEHCAPFSQAGSCQISAGCNLGSNRFRATNHHYVGGYYGASEEDPIKQELVANGPVVMSFEPKEDFMYYKNGVYKSVPNRIHQEWEQVDHAVLLVGFGEDAGQPYWTLQNSWGTDWGENGFFRMARGQDESGCESIVVAADVVQESSNEVLDNFVTELR